MQYVLLLNVWNNGGELKSSGISFQRVIAEICIRSDTTFGSGPTLVFSDLSVDLNGYEEWLAVTMLTVSDTDSKRMVTLTQQGPDTYALEDGQLRVEYGWRAPLSRYKLNWTQEARVTYIPPAPMSWDDLLVKYQAFQDLLVLLTDGYYGLEWPEVRGTNGAQCRCYFFRNRDLDRKRPLPDYPVPFSAIKATFGNCWSSWMSVRNELGPGAYLYLGTRKGTTLYPENRFMNLMWGIEALHRKRPERASRKDGVENKVGRIVGQVSKASDRKWLRTQLRHATEPSLADRIYDVFRDLPLQIEDGRLREFAKDCATLRNDISHFGGLRNEGVYEDFVKDAIRKGEAVSLLYHACLLQRIGVDSSILTYWVHNGPASYDKTHVLIDNGLVTANPPR